MNSLNKAWSSQELLLKVFSQSVTNRKYAITASNVYPASTTKHIYWIKINEHYYTMYLVGEYLQMTYLLWAAARFPWVRACSCAVSLNIPFSAAAIQPCSRTKCYFLVQGFVQNQIIASHTCFGEHTVKPVYKLKKCLMTWNKLQTHIWHHLHSLLRHNWQYLWFWKTFFAPSLCYPCCHPPPVFLPVHNSFYPSKWQVDGSLHKAMLITIALCRDPSLDG